MAVRAAAWRSRDRIMATAFAVGSLCFVVGPFPGYLALVGPTADAVTFFAGSVLFTVGGGLETWDAAPRRRDRMGGRAAWEAAVVQSLGTLFFNVTTFRALQTAVTASDYDRLVWRPDAFGSICFLVSGVIAYRASPRRRWRPVRGGPGWRQPAVNLLGCVLFGVAAVVGYVVPATGSVLHLAAANWTTSAGAACFLACAVPGVVARGGEPATGAAGNPPPRVRRGGGRPPAPPPRGGAPRRGALPPPPPPPGGPRVGGAPGAPPPAAG